MKVKNIILLLIGLALIVLGAILQQHKNPQVWGIVISTIGTVLTLYAILVGKQEKMLSNQRDMISIQDKMLEKQSKMLNNENKMLDNQGRMIKIFEDIKGLLGTK